jgi:enamine deaminase RidA (YjgF/YER057c/UK114 family)
VKVSRDPDDVHPPLANYAHQIEVSGGERLLMLSGQVGMRLDGSLPEDPVEQLDVAWDNVERNLWAAGMDTGDLVKVTIYLVGGVDVAARRRLLDRRLGDHRPCMTLVYVAALASPQLLVELDAWASRDGA